jgi:hypothetical protein
VPAVLIEVIFVLVVLFLACCTSAEVALAPVLLYCTPVGT